MKEKPDEYFKVNEGYRVALDAIREAINTVLRTSGLVLDDKNDRTQVLNSVIEHGCAIGFFRYREENESGDDMRMRIFHFSENTLKINFKHSEEFIHSVLTAVCRKKSYSQFDHLDHFRKHYCNDNGLLLYKVQIEEDDIIRFCPDKKTITIQGEVISWDKLLRDLNKPQSNYYHKYSKQLDHLLFSSGMEETYVIPVPILSSPSILVFLNAKAIQSLELGRREAYRLIRGILLKVSDALFFHLYNRLIVQFTEGANNSIQLEEINTEERLFAEFIKSISHILLPTRYRLDDGPWQKFFDWYGDEENCSVNKVKIEFTSSKSAGTLKGIIPAKHTAEFELPDYKVPVRSDSDHPDFIMRAKKNESGFFVSNDYWEQETKFRLTVQNLYQLIFSYWQAIRKSKDFVKMKLEPTLEQVQQIAKEIDISKLAQRVEQLSQNVAALSQGKITEGDGLFPIDSPTPDKLGKNTKFWFSFKNKRAEAQLKSIDVYRLHDLLSAPAGKAVEKLHSFQIMDQKRRETPSQLNPDAKNIRKEFYDCTKNLTDLEKLLPKNQADFATFIATRANRKKLYLCVLYFKKATNFSIKLKKLYNQPLYHKPLQHLDYKKIEQGLKTSYPDEYQNFIDNNQKIINQSTLKFANTSSTYSEFGKSIGRGIEKLINSHSNREAIIEYFSDAGLIIKVKSAKKGFTLAPNSIKNYRKAYFENWNFGNK